MYVKRPHKYRWGKWHCTLGKFEGSHGNLCVSFASGTAHWVNLGGHMEICVSLLQSNSYTLGDLINLNGVVDTGDNYW